MLRLWTVLSCALALTAPACSTSHRATDVVPGVYELTIRHEVDACSPARATGVMGAVGVVARTGVVDVPVPDAVEPDTLRVSLARTEGWHGSSMVGIDGCTAALLERSWTVLDTDEASFSVAYAERWRGMETCGEGLRWVMPAAPASDCDAELILDYALMEPCAAPCEVGVGPAGLGCFCE